MRDFYKILGVKEDASEEEIRERWVELTKQYHPDRGQDPSSDQRIREINEAYQVLKHSSTRVEYDLKRTFGQKKRRFPSKKLGVSAGILVIVIIIGIIYLTNSQNGTNQTDQTDQRNQINQTDKKSDIAASIPQPINVKAVPPQVTKKSQTNQKDQTDQRNQRNQTDKKNQIVASTRPPIPASTHEPIDVPVQQPRVVAVTPPVPVVLDQRNKTDQKNQTDQKDQTDKTSAATVSAAQLVEIAAQELRRRRDSAEAAEAQLQRPKDASESTDSAAPRPVGPGGPAGFNPPSLLGTEDEVRKFFNDYVERYNRMDLEGLFSLFSSRAIQNNKDRLEKIRKSYTNFFNQGQEVRYRLQDMKIEIYQNAVEVRARYEIDQILKMGERMVWKGNVHWVLGKENGVFKILSLDYQHLQIY